MARRLGRDLVGAGALFALFFASVVAGAAAHVAVAGDDPGYLIGASGGVFGLIGAAVYVLRSPRGALPHPLSRRVLVALAPWALVNVMIAALGGRFMGADVAWVAHLGGLAAGWALFPVLVRLRN